MAGDIPPESASDTTLTTTSADSTQQSFSSDKSTGLGLPADQSDINTASAGNDNVDGASEEQSSTSTETANHEEQTIEGDNSDESYAEMQNTASQEDGSVDIAYVDGGYVEDSSNLEPVLSAADNEQEPAGMNFDSQVLQQAAVTDDAAVAAPYEAARLISGDIQPHQQQQQQPQVQALSLPGSSSTSDAISKDASISHSASTADQVDASDGMVMPAAVDAAGSDAALLDSAPYNEDLYSQLQPTSINAVDAAAPAIDCLLTSANGTTSFNPDCTTTPAGNEGVNTLAIMQGNVAANQSSNAGSIDGAFIDSDVQQETASVPTTQAAVDDLVKAAVAAAASANATSQPSLSTSSSSGEDASESNSTAAEARDEAHVTDVEAQGGTNVVTSNVTDTVDDVGPDVTAPSAELNSTSSSTSSTDSSTTDSSTTDGSSSITDSSSSREQQESVMSLEEATAQAAQAANAWTDEDEDEEQQQQQQMQPAPTDMVVAGDNSPAVAAEAGVVRSSMTVSSTQQDSIVSGASSAGDANSSSTSGSSSKLGWQATTGIAVGCFIAVLVGAGLFMMVKSRQISNEPHPYRKAATSDAGEAPRLDVEMAGGRLQPRHTPRQRDF